MSLIPFPNVPSSPGVPAVPRSASFPTVARAGLSVLQGVLWRAFQIDTRWGVFDSAGNPLGGTNAGIFENILESVGLSTTLSTASVEYSKETRVSDFPLAEGSFASYNKVELPAAPVVTLCLSGDEAARRTFLDAIDAACKSTNLYSVVTPEVTYVEYAIERYNYARRRERGATLLAVELTLKEVRQVSAQYTAAPTPIQAPQDVGATTSTDGGKVQARPPETSTLKGLANKLPEIFN